MPTIYGRHVPHVRRNVSGVAMGEFVAVMTSLRSGLPVFLVQFGLAVALWLVAWRIALWLAPAQSPSDLADSNTAIAIVRSGEAVALAIPMAACLAGSVNVADIVLWGSVVLLLQLLCSLVSRWAVANFAERIRAGSIAVAVSVLLVRTGFALINAAAIAS